MRIFITGARGFIGSYVAYELLQASHELVVVARDAHKLTALSNHPRVRRLTATLNDRELMRAALEPAPSSRGGFSPPLCPVG